MRIYLLGRPAIETGGRILPAGTFPGRQGRLVFTRLAWERTRVGREALADMIWPEALPDSWEVALSAIVSKLRRLFDRLGAPGSATIDGSDGAYELRLPEGTWVDVRAAVNALDRAEGLLRSGDPGRAWGEATVASAILRRPLLPGESSAWVEVRRRELLELRIRTVDCLTCVWRRRGDHALALQAAHELVELAPFRESAHARLMECHLEVGDRAEAIRVYGRLRELLREEMGIDPTPAVQALYEQALEVSRVPQLEGPGGGARRRPTASPLRRPPRPPA